MATTEAVDAAIRDVERARLTLRIHRLIDQINADRNDNSQEA